MLSANMKFRRIVKWMDIGSTQQRHFRENSSHGANIIIVVVICENGIPGAANNRQFSSICSFFPYKWINFFLPFDTPKHFSHLFDVSADSGVFPCSKCKDCLSVPSLTDCYLLWFVLWFFFSCVCVWSKESYPSRCWLWRDLWIQVSGLLSSQAALLVWNCKGEIVNLGWND